MDNDVEVLLIKRNTSVTSRRSQDMSTYWQQSLLGWNRLPTELKQLWSTASFRQKLKTHLFYLP